MKPKNPGVKPYIANTEYNKLTMRIARIKGRLKIIKAKGGRLLPAYTGGNYTKNILQILKKERD